MSTASICPRFQADLSGVSSMVRRLAALVAITVWLGASHVIAAPTPQPTPSTGQELLDKPLQLKFTAVSGAAVDLQSMHGKVVLIDFWATWCGPCRGELPQVLAAYAKYHEQGFEIVGISLDQDKEALLKYIQSEKMTWSQYFDGQMWNNAISKSFGIHSIPAMWLVDKRGVLVDINARADLAGRVEKLLSAPSGVAWAPSKPDAAAAANRRAVPSVKDQAKVAQTIRGLFKHEYAERSVAGKKSLAEKLLAQGTATQDDAAARFVCFREARDLAASSGDLTLAMSVIDAIEKEFDIETSDMRAAAFLAAAPLASPADSAATGATGLAVVDLLIAAENFTAAHRIMSIVEPLATRSKQVPLVSKVGARKAELAEFQRLARDVPSARESLKQKPGDPSANLTVGGYLAFVKGDWNAALPLLAHGADSVLKALAARELANPSDANAKMRLADDWWDVAEAKADQSKARVRQHAADWYEKAWPGTVGADRTKAESRLPAEVLDRLKRETAINTSAAAQSTPQGAVPPAAPVAIPVAPGVANVDLTLLASNAMSKLGGYRPQRLTLSPDRPAALKKAPQLAAPLYSQIQFGGVSYLVVLDEPDGMDPKLYVDANGNGDLTDDPPATWVKRMYGQILESQGDFRLPLPTSPQPTMVSLHAYRFDKNDPKRTAYKFVMFYYSDYAYDGQITLDGTKYHAMLSDDLASGDFRGNPSILVAGVRLRIDLNGDGKFNAPFKMFDVAKPFNIKGTTWKLANVTQSGSFNIEKSTETVAEIPATPNLSAGAAALPFRAQTMDGVEVNFPGDYKGKLVLLDFWATWCGPCMQEVPGLVAAYEQLHPRGLEVLGVTLDQQGAAAKIKTVTGEKKMTWKQVYDGQFWEARVAKMYGVQSIPHAFLVDGDTGKIVAEGGSLRGESLARTIETALKTKANGTAK